MKIAEKYHLFKRGKEACVLGIYGLTRKYSHIDTVKSTSAKSNKLIEIDILPPKTQVVQINITTNCNLKCLYCSFKANTPADIPKRMILDELIQTCDYINNSDGRCTVLISGGEPELFPEAVDYILGQAAGKIIIFTNGTLTTTERLKKYKKHETIVVFSLDGDQTLHNRMRKGANDTYANIRRTLLKAKELQIDFGISTVVNDHNIDSLKETVEKIITKYNPGSLGLNLPHKYKESAWNRIDEYIEAMKDIFPLAKNEGLFIDQINRRLSPLVNRKFRLRDCSAQGLKTVIFPGGIRTNCVNELGLERKPQDWSKEIPIFKEECSDCYAIGICGGGCVFDGWSIYGEHEFDKRNCEFTKRMLEFFIWEMRDSLGDDAANDELVKREYSSMLSYGKGSKISIGHELG